MGKENIVWHRHEVSREDRERIKGHRGGVLWFTGLSGSGKSTIANALERRLNAEGVHTYLLDGDNIRHGLNGDLGFGEEDRRENLRRVGEVAKLFADAGLIVLCAFISPYREERDRIRKMVGEREFVEIFVDTPLEECIERDPKGLYDRALKNEIENFTGVDAPYEAPESPDLHIETVRQGVEASVERIVEYMREKGIVNGTRKR